MPSPSQAQRYVDQCNTYQRNIIATFLPQPNRIDQPESSECRYYYWYDGSGAVFDLTEGKAHILPNGF